MVTDVQGKAYAVGQKVAQPFSLNAGGSCSIRIRTVEKIASGKIYLDGSPTPIKFPERLAIIN